MVNNEKSIQAVVPFSKSGAQETTQHGEKEKMTNVSTTCLLPTLDQFIGELVDNQTQLAGIGPGIGIGVATAAADVVATSLAFVGLEAFIIATVLQGDTLTELLLELQTNPELKEQVQTRVRTEVQRCITPSIGSNFGMGSRKVSTMQMRWNQNGNNAMELMQQRTGAGAFTATTPAQSQALANWRRAMANLFNCVEMLIESGIACQPEKRGQRCRVPAIVERCILRAGEKENADQ